MDTISEEYRRLSEQTHRDDPEYGTAAKNYFDHLWPFLESQSTTSILDYGCGKSELQKFLPFEIQQYDPAIPRFSRPPKPAKVVVCSDVMEHVEEDRVDTVLDHIQSLARQSVYFGISVVPASNQLPDGRNRHITLRSRVWWLERLLKRWEPISYTWMDNGLMFIGRPHEAQEIQ